MKHLVTLALILLAAATAAAEPFTLTDDFVAYMKTVTNPHAFGQRNGRFFPYSTRYGRRIGYARPVADKSLYARGETSAEAEQHLRAGLAATLAALPTWLSRAHPGQSFDSLPRPAQEILLDRAFTAGVENLPPEFCAAVLASDWTTLLNRHLYVRGLGNWPDSIMNYAFARRWSDVGASHALLPASAPQRR